MGQPDKILHLKRNRNSEVLTKLDRAFDEWIEKAEVGTVLEPKLSDETIKQLEALGYIVR